MFAAVSISGYIESKLSVLFDNSVNRYVIYYQLSRMSACTYIKCYFVSMWYSFSISPEKNLIRLWYILWFLFDNYQKHLRKISQLVSDFYLDLWQKESFVNKPILLFSTMMEGSNPGPNEISWHILYFDKSYMMYIGFTTVIILYFAIVYCVKVSLLL